MWTEGRVHLYLAPRELDNRGMVSDTAGIATIWSNFYDWRYHPENSTILCIDYGKSGVGVTHPIVEETILAENVEEIFGGNAIAAIFDYEYDIPDGQEVPSQMAGRLKNGRYFYWRAWNYNTEMALDHPQFDYQGGTKVYLTHSYTDLLEHIVPTSGVLERFLNDQ